jgi:ankyrin repeat protein
LLADPDGVDPNDSGPGDTLDGYSMNAACANDHIGIVQLLLECGVDSNADGGELKYAIHFAAFCYPFIAKLLIAWGADVNRIGGTTRSAALQLATKRLNTECMKVLLDHDADLNSARGPLDSPLHAAAPASLAVTALPLERGANPRVARW